MQISSLSHIRAIKLNSAGLLFLVWIKSFFNECATFFSVSSSKYYESLYKPSSSSLIESRLGFTFHFFLLLDSAVSNRQYMRDIKAKARAVHTSLLNDLDISLYKWKFPYFTVSAVTLRKSNAVIGEDAHCAA